MRQLHRRGTSGRHGRGAGGDGRSRVRRRHRPSPRTSRSACIAGKTGAARGLRQADRDRLHDGPRIRHRRHDEGRRPTRSWSSRRTTRSSPTSASRCSRRPTATTRSTSPSARPARRVALAMLPVAEEYKKILIVEPAVADRITGDKWNRYIFRTGAQLHAGRARRRGRARQGRDVAIAHAGAGLRLRPRRRRRRSRRRWPAMRPQGQDRARGIRAGRHHRLHRRPAQRMFDALKDKPGRKIIGIIWAGAAPAGQDRRPEARALRHRARARRQHPAGDERLEAVRRHRGRDLLLLRLPQEPDERLARGRAPEALQRAAGLLHRGRHRGGVRGGRQRSRRPAAPTPRS